MELEEAIIKASKETDVESFMKLIFPPEWSPIIARIVESGVEFSETMCDWAPRWSKIPNTIKRGHTELEGALKICLYKAHDCFHQLWGLPIPGPDFSEDDFYSFKRAQMCGEVAVLTISEFFLSKYIYDHCEKAQPLIYKRCAIPMMEGPLKGKSLLDVAMRMDTILHKKERPKWLRDHKESSSFADYYVPMLEDDRRAIDHNWACMKLANWRPIDAPNSRYSKNLDGLELTLWMVEDFLHLLKTDPEIDRELANFNKSRRRKIEFPTGWGKI